MNTWSRSDAIHDPVIFVITVYVIAYRLYGAETLPKPTMRAQLLPILSRERSCLCIISVLNKITNFTTLIAEINRAYTLTLTSVFNVLCEISIETKYVACLNILSTGV